MPQPVVLHAWRTGEPENSQISFYSLKVGTLSVNQRAEAGENLVLWERIGSQGDKWIKATIQIPVSPAPYNLVIEGSMGAPDTRGVSIDDIVLVDHACPVDEAATCTFENDLCTFKNTNGGTAWQKKSAKNAGVVRDHTTGTNNGHLAFLDLSQDNSDNPGGDMDGAMHSGNLQFQELKDIRLVQVAKRFVFIHSSWWQAPNQLYCKFVSRKLGKEKEQTVMKSAFKDLEKLLGAI